MHDSARIPQQFADVETAVYGNNYPHHSQPIDTINRLHDLLRCNYPELRYNVFFNEKCRLISYELPNLQLQGERAAYFGYWECQNDNAAVDAIFTECARHLRERGIKRLIGPINFSTFFDYRIRLNHFERLSYPGEPHNKPYYQHLLEQCGFNLLEKYFSIYTDSVAAPLQRLHQKAGRVIQRGHPFTIVPLERADIDGSSPQVYRLIDSAFKEAVAYVPLTENLFKLFFNSTAIGKFCKKTSFVAFLNDEVVGLLLSLPDWAELSDSARAVTLNAAAIDTEKYFDALMVKRAYIKTVCVNPELRNSGLYVHLVDHFLNACQTLYSESGAALIRLDNAADKLGSWLFEDGASTKIEYGLFAKAID